MPGVWQVLTYLGDGAVLLPCALLLFAWLIAAPASRRTGCLWLAAVVLVSAGVASSKLVYMLTGWHPAGWNFIGLSGHAALSCLFWPAAGALLTARSPVPVRVVAVAAGVCLALAIAASSWVLRDHSLVEVVTGTLWGALVAAAFLLLARWQALPAPAARAWVIAGMLVVAVAMVNHELPSTRVLGWFASKVTGHVHTRRDLGPRARLSNPIPHPRPYATEPDDHDAHPGASQP